MGELTVFPKDFKSTPVLMVKGGRGIQHFSVKSHFICK